MGKSKFFALNSKLVIFTIHGDKQGMYMLDDDLVKLMIIGIGLSKMRKIVSVEVGSFPSEFIATVVAPLIKLGDSTNLHVLVSSMPLDFAKRDMLTAKLLHMLLKNLPKVSIGGKGPWFGGLKGGITEYTLGN